MFREAAALGVLQVHLSGGEPASRRDLVEITAAAHDAGLYTNLITSAVGVTHATLGKRSPMPASITCRSRSRTASPAPPIASPATRAPTRASDALAAEVDAARPAADRQRRHASRQHRSRRRDGRARAVARREARRDRACAVLRLGAEEPRAADADARAGRARGRRRSSACASEHHGRIVIDAVMPDYYARFPKACMGGWGRRSLNVTPSGQVLPCHAAETIPGLEFWNRCASMRSPRSGTIRRRSWRFAAPTGCRSRARCCPSARRISAAAAARRSR